MENAAAKSPPKLMPMAQMLGMISPNSEQLCGEKLDALNERLRILKEIRQTKKFAKLSDE